MRIACVYSVDSYETVEKPLRNSSEIPFGISVIATVLKEHKHDVDLLVVTQATAIEALLGSYIAKNRPRMLCLTAVSSQFAVIDNVARVVKKLDPSIFVVLGGHYASLAPDDAIQSPYLDAICIGEGDEAVIALASQIASSSAWPTGIPNLWIKSRASGSVEKNATLPFNQALDSLPFIDRALWEPWIVAPQEEVSILVGRGCPFKCTYCSNHAMAALSKGRYVRYRSPENMIAEIESVCRQYPELRRIYLEVETIGASITKALALFEAMAKYNSSRSEKLTFRMNLAVQSKFVKNEEEVREFFAHCRKANVVGLNIGLESGSERIRKEVLRRAHYTNDELIRFASMAREYGISIVLFVMIGIPGETPKDFLETVEVIRRIRPETVLSSIFYPYVGTDLYDVAKARGLIPAEGLDGSGERRKATLDLPGFPRWRVRFEYVALWYRVYSGAWPFPKIFAHMARAYIAPYPKLESAYKYARSHSKLVSVLKRKLAARDAA
jgi:radical SAM superfamily enzyme YgiQ (UPF0313 family)